MNPYEIYSRSGGRDEFDFRAGLFCQLALTATHSDESSVLLYDSASETLRFVSTYDASGPVERLLGHSVPLGEGITGLAAKTGDVQIGAPSYQDAELSEATGAVRHVVAAPIIVDDRLVGAMTAISFSRPESYTMTDGRSLASAAEAVALACAGLFEKAEGGGSARINEATARALTQITASLERLPATDPAIAASIETLLRQLDIIIGALADRRSVGHL